LSDLVFYKIVATNDRLLKTNMRLKNMNYKETPLSWISNEHYFLLLAYRTERSYAQTHRAISHCLGKDINLGRKIPSFSQELSDWGLIKRTNPGSSRRAGYKYIITSEGDNTIEKYSKAINSISNPQPEFGF
jgi:hypothetical protein